MIQGNCSGCGKTYSVRDDWAGRTVTCPACQTKFTLAAPARSERAPNEEVGYQLAGEPPPALANALLSQTDDGPTTSSDADVAQRPKKPAVKHRANKPRSKPAPTATAPHDPGGRWYLVLAVALVPLAWSLLSRSDTTLDRLHSVLEEHPEALAAVLEAEPESPEALYDIVTLHLPERRLPEAHLPRNTIWHWVYAAVAAGLMFALVLAILPRGTTTPKSMVVVAAAIATGGVCLLLCVQAVAAFSGSLPMRGHVLWALLVGILRLVGFSYRAAFDPSADFVSSFFGFTFGVGLCEELIKLLPVVCYLRSDDEDDLDWRGAAAWGAAAGVGFGVAEGVVYSADFYNGIAAGDVYVVRFISCVALHAIWSAAAGILAWRHRELLVGSDLEFSWHELGLFLLYAIGGSALLHGLYDTLLKKDVFLGALVVAGASVAMLAVLIETRRSAEAA